MYTFVVFDDGDLVARKAFDFIIDGAEWFKKTYDGRRSRLKVFETEKLPAVFQQTSPVIVAE